MPLPLWSGGYECAGEMAVSHIWLTAYIAYKLQWSLFPLKCALFQHWNWTWLIPKSQSNDLSCRSWFKTICSYHALWWRWRDEGSGKVWKDILVCLTKKRERMANWYPGRNRNGTWLTDIHPYRSQTDVDGSMMSEMGCGNRADDPSNYGKSSQTSIEDLSGKWLIGSR